jgi:hypothetical protein
MDFALKPSRDQRMSKTVPLSSAPLYLWCAARFDVLSASEGIAKTNRQ